MFAVEFKPVVLDVTPKAPVVVYAVPSIVSPSRDGAIVFPSWPVDTAAAASCKPVLGLALGGGGGGKVMLLVGAILPKYLRLMPTFRVG